MFGHNGQFEAIVFPPNQMIFKIKSGRGLVNIQY